MKTSRKTAISTAMALASVVLLGCGEDGKGVADSDHCPEQPLYHYVFRDGGGGGSTGYWAARKADGTKLTAAEESAIREARAIDPAREQNAATAPDQMNVKPSPD